MYGLCIMNVSDSGHGVCVYPREHEREEGRAWGTRPCSVASDDNPDGRQNLPGLCLPLELPCGCGGPGSEPAPLPGRGAAEAAQGGAAVPSSGHCPPNPQLDPQQLQETLPVPFLCLASPCHNSLSPTHFEGCRKSPLCDSLSPERQRLSGAFITAQSLHPGPSRFSPVGPGPARAQPTPFHHSDAPTSRLVTRSASSPSCP